MRGVAARYPALDSATGRPIDLQGRINQCRQARQGAEPFAAESQELLALTTIVAHQSRGMPVAAGHGSEAHALRRGGAAAVRAADRPARPSPAPPATTGAEAQKLGGSVIPQAHPTGYPIYRLEWQSVGSLQRRMRNRMIGVRAEPYAWSAPEFTALELYLRARAEGLPVETPGVRP